MRVFQIGVDFRFAALNSFLMNVSDSFMGRVAGLRLERFLVMLVLTAGLCASPLLHAQSNDTVTVLKIQADQVAARVSPKLYGLMTEEINYSYDGGLYAELVRNRTFKWNTNNPAYWRFVGPNEAAGSMSLDFTGGLNAALSNSLKVVIANASANQPVGIANDGFWGIPARPKTKYRASFYAKAAKGFKGPLTVSIVSTNDNAVLASGKVRRISDSWEKYELTLTTGNISLSKSNELRITAENPGTIWFSLVSLFPPTYNDRPNGNRPDIMQLLADMHPAFLRFPGGNYLEGNTIATRFDWKKTIGDISQRPGHRNDAWNYWSTDGMGLLEFLEWCEDLRMDPVLAVYAGYSLRQQRIAPGKDLEPYVQDALEEIEYVTGDTKTKWGARRAKDGHPKPFKLEYVEVGNEDFFDRGTNSYEARFAQFYDAIKAKYPRLQIIATTPVKSRRPDVIDDHFYRSSMEMQSDTHHYDKTDRSGSKIFVGEWATREGSPTPNMNAALGDAAWMTGMERNSDMVIMSCYAPLFVNVNPGGMQWRTDLIGYDTLTSYGSPAYYAQQMFSRNCGDVVLTVGAQDIPTREWQPPTRRRGGEPVPAPSPQQVPSVFFNATRDSQSGIIFLKLVNTAGAPQNVQVEIAGVKGIDATGQVIALSASKPEDTNSITEPRKIVPVTTEESGFGTEFKRVLPPYSITVLKLKGS